MPGNKEEKQYPNDTTGRAFIFVIPMWYQDKVEFSDSGAIFIKPQNKSDQTILIPSSDDRVDPSTQ